MNKAIKKIDIFFFSDDKTINLGICRFIFYALIFVFYLGEDFSHWGRMDKVFWEPILIFEYLSIPVVSPQTLFFLNISWLTAIFLSSIGLFTRINTFIAFILSIYIFGLVNSYGKLQHMENVMVVIMGIMAFSRCGDLFSIDSWLNNQHWFKFKSKASTYNKWEYSWPIKLIWVFMTLVFFSAALSKLRNTGLEWVTDDGLSTVFIKVHFVGARSDPLYEGLALWLGTKLIVCKVLAGITLLLELFSPLSLFNKYLRLMLIPSLFIMILMFWVIMGISFPQLLICFVFWVPWHKLVPDIRNNQKTNLN